MTASATRRHPRYPDYPPRVIEFARRLAANGYTAYRIREALTRRGYEPACSTIKRWTDPDYAEAVRRGKRRGGRPGPKPRKAWRRRLERMQELRGLGLSFRAIAALMSHDFEDIEITEEQARSILNGTTPPSSARRLLWPKSSPSQSERSHTA